MKYIIRAIKYFFYFVFLVAAIILVLSLAGLVSKNPEDIFRNGYDSYWQIAAMFAAVAAFYPMFGFMKKIIHVPGEFSEIKPLVVKAMDAKGYELEKQDGENLSFRAKRPWKRFTSMYEDRITMTRTIDGFKMEGLRRDVVAVSYYVEDRVNGNVE